MTESQTIWTQARDRLVAAVNSLGYPSELGDLMAKQLGSPKAMDRMTSYILHVRPRNEEMLIDEMLAICDDVNAWRRKKEGQDAQARYNTYLFQRRAEDEEDE